ncbi:bifunctional riboflavin kinase/FAD synthetase [Stratiformator vulcanicus]|uniref:Riboflavin biosynthesis protein n=1 Tax=Stratiformator vulcanicus TaxID=2527980 RepID=A0A517R2T8_9PLAN|nr:bifunctional riboflavin kinase/FAD synthetase [Stratiformator vulcanicus]QDT38192.1 Riboflavin kinase [Stratiformator vulcanicus]
MALFDAPNETCRGGCLTIGNFDGVHLGHRRMIARLRREADRLGGPAVVATFDPHPAELLRPELAPAQLTTILQRSELLHAAGADQVVVLETNHALLNSSPRDFFDRVIVREFAARGLVEGPNFHFGKDREGDTALLAEFCREHGIELHVLEPQSIADEMISSSRVRKALGEGDVEQAAELLGRPYQISGRVSHGAGRGAGLGFPTANLSEIETLIPAEGVYGGRVQLNETSYAAAIHIGKNATFDADESTVEVHLLDFSGSLYDMILNIDFLTYVRTSRKFDSAEELQHQMVADCEQIRASSAT